MIAVRDLIGAPYKVHGRTVEEGLDCYGLLIEVYSRAGIMIPDAFYAGTSTAENMKNYPKLKELVANGLSLVPVDHPVELCVVCLAMTGREVSHVGIYIGDGLMLHSVQGSGVCAEPLSRFRHLIRGYYTIDNR